MDADKNGVGESIRELDSLFKRSGFVARSRKLNLKTSALQFLTRREGNIEGVGFFIAKGPGRSAVLAAMAGIDHYSVDWSGAADAIRTKNWLDDFGNIHC